MITTLDTETSGMVKWGVSSEDPGQPRIVEVGAIFDDKDGKTRHIFNAVIKPIGFTIPVEASNIHGITQELAMDIGLDPKGVMETVRDLIKRSQRLVCHNIGFDHKMLKIEAHRQGMPDFRELLDNILLCCTMNAATNIVGIPSPRGRGYKWPTLAETVKFFFNETLEGAHTAIVDTKACRRIYRELLSRGIDSVQIPKKV